ncbi:outer membrane efflux protein [Thermotomaculum hydrothermale]|uniref:Outer membrane efflux protein n=1 Tax=Thermotomaculum hydrothermale TaxID=981385 RepID=A0A7R6SYL0_9BACT|nr:TolC family protein [Thermotomaculum hydrothermale]BBB31950.1 outer membrane efflux protein [Thermotomaculum hydrothermale]
MRKITVLVLLLFSFLLEAADFNTLLENAFKNNKEIQSAMKEVKSSEYQVKSVRSLYFPDIEAGYFKVIYDKEPLVVLPAGSFAPIDVYFPLTDDNFTNFNITLNWLLYDFGGRSSAYKSAKKGFEAAILNVNLTKRQVAINLLDRYTDALTLKSYIDVINHSIDAINSHLKDIKEFREEGFVPKSDVLRIEALKLNLEAQKAELKGKLKVVLGDIERISFTKVNEDDISPLKDIKLWKEPVKLALENREELKLLKTQSDVYKLKAKIEKSLNLPQLVAKVEYNDTTNALNPVKSNTTYYVGVKFKIFDGMKSHYNKKRYLKLSEKTTDLYDDTKEKIKIQIENELETLNALKKQYKFSKKAFEAAKENYRVVKLQFKEHIVSSVDLKDAITDLKQNEANYLITGEKLKAQKIKILWLCKKLGEETHEE